MPTYQYACNACNHEFEIFQDFQEASLTICPECAGEIRKVYSAVGVVFKGSGFYKTDSKSSSSAIISPTASKDSSAVKEKTPTKESTSTNEGSSTKSSTESTSTATSKKE